MSTTWQVVGRQNPTMPPARLGVTPEILLLQAHGIRCPSSDCDRLPEALCTLFPSTKLKIRRTPLADEELRNAIVVLHSDRIVNVSEQAATIRRQVRNCAVLGVLCGLREDEEIPPESLQCLDDHICCPYWLMDLNLRVRRLLLRVVEEETVPSEHTQERLAGIIGDSPRLCEVVAKVPAIASSDSNCVLEGETGTGKELFARAIHYLSPRKGKPFVPVNCGALPDHLVENELFGHVKGAFTDASGPECGLLAYAEDGTLFLDEIDALSPAAQVKLLRVLQEREYRPVGSARMVKMNARVLAATNSDLQQLVAARQFRHDLYYRLNVLRLVIPTLRARREDIPLLAQHFLRLYAEAHHKRARHIAPGALYKLSNYAWPGNVRELEAVMQRAVLMSVGHSVEASDLDLPGPPPNNDNSGHSSLRTAKALVVEQFERSYLTKMLVQHNGNITQAAESAGKERRSFQRLLHKYQINTGEFRRTLHK